MMTPPVMRFFACALCSVLSTLIVGSLVFANTADVTLKVPVGIIAVQGKTSPNAQVKIYEDGSDEPTASLTADALGVFSGELPQDQAGLVDVGVQVIDTNGTKSPLIVKQVAVISQQTSVLTIIVPPTISVEPSVVVFQEGTLTFRGQTVPNATVKIVIESGITLETSSDSQGRYEVPLLVKSLKSVGVYTYGVEVAAGVEVSSYVTAGTFVISPPVQSPISPSIDPFQKISHTITSASVHAPEITFPEESSHVSSDPFVIIGRSSPGATVVLYDNDLELGAVVADADGSWKFYFSPYKASHSLYAKSCVQGKCSEKSRTITVRMPELSASSACRPGLTLDIYRQAATVDSPVTFRGELAASGSAAVYVSWGDGSSERFSSPGMTLNVDHTYSEVGVYSGYMILDSTNHCQSAVYFSVEVSESNRSIGLAIMFGVIVAGMVATMYWTIRRRRNPPSDLSQTARVE